MSPKEYLQQIYIITKRLQRLRQLCDQLREDAYSIGSPMGSLSPDKVQTSPSGDQMGRAIARVDKTERQIRSEMDRLKKKRLTIHKQIEALPDERYRAILFHRYVLCHKWEKVAEDVNMDLRYVYRLHGEALRDFGERYNIGH